MKKVIISASIILAIFLIIITAFYEQSSVEPLNLPVNTDDTLEESEEKEETITLTAAGDCLMHNTQIWSGMQQDGSYSFPTFLLM